MLINHPAFSHSLKYPDMHIIFPRCAMTSQGQQLELDIEQEQEQQQQQQHTQPSSLPTAYPPSGYHHSLPHPPPPVTYGSYGYSPYPLPSYYPLPPQQPPFAYHHAYPTPLPPQLPAPVPYAPPFSHPSYQHSNGSGNPGGKYHDYRQAISHYNNLLAPLSSSSKSGRPSTSTNITPSPNQQQQQSSHHKSLRDEPRAAYKDKQISPARRCISNLSLKEGDDTLDVRHVISLSMPEDNECLSDRQCFVRSRLVEAFCATEEDVTARHSKGAQKLAVGQVGLRCKFCHDVSHKERAERAVCYPSSVTRIYQTVADMQRFHFEICAKMPKEVKEEYGQLRTTRPRGVGSPQNYWVMSAEAKGLVDSEFDGIRLCKELPMTDYMQLYRQSLNKSNAESNGKRSRECRSYTTVSEQNNKAAFRNSMKPLVESETAKKKRTSKNQLTSISEGSRAVGIENKRNSETISFQENNSEKISFQKHNGGLQTSESTGKMTVNDDEANILLMLRSTPLRQKKNDGIL